MKKSNLFVVIMLLVSAVLFTSGVVKKINILKLRKTAQKTIAVIPKGTVNIWWEVVHQGAEKAAAERGCRMIWVGPEKETDREKQIQIVEDALSQGVDAVVLAPNDEQALVRSIENIRRKNLPCVLMDSAANTDKYDSLVATDGYQSSAEAAEIMGKKMGGKGKLIIIRYVQGATCSAARGDGFLDTIRKNYPGIEVLADQHTLGTIEDARKTTEDLLVRFPQADCLFAVNQPSSIGAYKAIQNLNSKGKICFIGYDSDPVLLQGIEQGEVEMLVVQNPLQIGYLGTMAAMDRLEGKTLERSVAVPVMHVDRDNVQQMKKDFPQALGL